MAYSYTGEYYLRTEVFFSCMLVRRFDYKAAIHGCIKAISRVKPTFQDALKFMCARGDKSLCPDVASWTTPPCEPTQQDLVLAFTRLKIPDPSVNVPPVVVAHEISGALINHYGLFLYSSLY